jgi:hypothetical protein
MSETEPPAPRFTPEQIERLRRLGSCTTCGQQAPRCDDCIRRVRSYLTSTARVRGERWAELALLKMVRTRRALEPWPSWDASEKVRALAYARIDDLDREEQIRDLLARDAHDAAARRWAELLADDEKRRQLLISR